MASWTTLEFNLHETFHPCFGPWFAGPAFSVAGYVLLQFRDHHGNARPKIAKSLATGFCYTNFYAYESARAVVVADFSLHFRCLSERERVARRTGGRVVNGSRL